MNRFAGCVAIVTGAGSGIGAATAQRLAEEGALVVVADVDAARARAVAEAIAGSGGRAEPEQVDVRDRGQVERLIHGARDRHGRLDVLHNNAGVGSFAPLEVVDEATIRRLLDVNVEGVLHGLAVAGPLMQAQGRGAIVNTASAAALFGVPLQVAYSASKGAVVSATKAAAMEYSPHVRVNAICPGGVRTNFVEAAIGIPMPPSMEEVSAKATPMRRMAEPAEIAAVVAFLASDDASYVTGAILSVDGGVTAGATIDLG